MSCVPSWAYTNGFQPISCHPTKIFICKRGASHTEKKISCQKDTSGVFTVQKHKCITLFTDLGETETHFMEKNVHLNCSAWTVAEISWCLIDIGFLDPHQKLWGSFLGRDWSSIQVLWKSVPLFWCNRADKPTNCWSKHIQNKHYKHCPTVDQQ